MRTELIHKIMCRKSSPREKTDSCWTSVALQHEELDDPLIHKPHDEVRDMLQTHVLQNSRKLYMSLLHMFPDNLFGEYSYEFVHVGKSAPQ